ncbi:MAG: ABC transporter ATP-binding protein [Actinomycetaceae bacterium]|nr:ABC transporter ATP-binding protein [Actinomycetaceae bacterium]
MNLYDSQSSPETVVHVRGLHKSYGARPALDGVDLDLRAGRIVGLMGQNGCGKTTLMKVMAGLLSDYRGTVEICGLAPGVETKRLLAFLPDKSMISPELTARGAVDLFADFFDDFDRAKALEMLRFFDLGENLKVRHMSKGMAEKLQISLVMSRNVRVYLLDEPISGVDPAARSVILDGVIRGFNEDSLMVISTHLIQDIESVVDEAVFVSWGKIAMHRDADEIREVDGKSIDGLFREMFSCSPR